MLNVIFSDGSQESFQGRHRILDLAAAKDSGLSERLIAACVGKIGEVSEIGGQTDSEANAETGEPQLRDASEFLPESGTVSLRFLTASDPEAAEIRQRSAAFLTARAVIRLFSGVQFVEVSATADGFTAEFIPTNPLTESDFDAIEKEIDALLDRNERFERIEIPKTEAIPLLADMGQTLLSERLARYETPDIIPFYRQGEFLTKDAGPFVPAPRLAGRVTLTGLSDADCLPSGEPDPIQTLCGRLQENA